MLQKQVILTYSNAEGMWDKLDVTYQSAFAASGKPSPPEAAFTYPLKKILHALTGSQKLSTPSPVARGADYVSPYKEKYWDVMTNNIRKQMVGMKENYILDAINILRNENPEYHDSIINHLINEYDEFNQSCDVDADLRESEGLK